jgi:hypothetical protein
MWSAIAAVIAAIGSGIKLAADWLAKKRDDLLLSLGRTQQSNTDLQGRIDALQKANDARETSHGESERNPDSILSDDGFQRKDD